MPEESVMEEVLEFVWSDREMGSHSIEKLLKTKEVCAAKADYDTLREMESMGLITVEGDSVYLTEAGEGRARSIIRRHRLAERLLTEVLDMDGEALEQEACDFEHILSPGVTDSICTLLGHPPTCPHGLNIPQGECCKKQRVELKPLVKSLMALNPGDRARIIFIVTGIHSRLDKLSSLGLVPGSVVRVHQKKPAFVIEIGETTLAIDSEIVKDIFVRRLK